MKGFIKKKIKEKKGEGYVDSGVKILIAVVIGALLLGGVYMLFKDTIMPTAQSKVESLFDYEAPPQIKLTSFSYDGMKYQAEEGMTWGEWVNSEYNSTSLSVKNSGIIGRDDGNGAGIEVYYTQNGVTKYVKSDELIDSNTIYKVMIITPLIKL